MSLQKKFIKNMHNLKTDRRGDFQNLRNDQKNTEEANRQAFNLFRTSTAQSIAKSRHDNNLYNSMKRDDARAEQMRNDALVEANRQRRLRENQ